MRRVNTVALDAFIQLFSCITNFPLTRNKGYSPGGYTKKIYIPDYVGNWTKKTTKVIRSRKFSNTDVKPENAKRYFLFIRHSVSVHPNYVKTRINNNNISGIIPHSGI